MSRKRIVWRLKRNEQFGNASGIVSVNLSKKMRAEEDTNMNKVPGGNQKKNKKSNSIKDFSLFNTD